MLRTKEDFGYGSMFPLKYISIYIAISFIAHAELISRLPAKNFILIRT
jgi:hypothetical protein